MTNSSSNINWLVAGIATFIIFPPLGLLILIFAAATGRISGLAAKITFAVLALIILMIFLVFVVFDKAVHFA